MAGEHGKRSRWTAGAGAALLVALVGAGAALSPAAAAPGARVLGFGEADWRTPGVLPPTALRPGAVQTRCPGARGRRLYVFLRLSGMRPGQRFDVTWQLDGHDIFTIKQRWSLSQSSGNFRYYVENGGRPVANGRWGIALKIGRRVVATGSVRRTCVPIGPTGARILGFSGVDWAQPGVPPAAVVRPGGTQAACVGPDALRLYVFVDYRGIRRGQALEVRWRRDGQDYFTLKRRWPLRQTEAPFSYFVDNGGDKPLDNGRWSVRVAVGKSVLANGFVARTCAPAPPPPPPQPQPAPPPQPQPQPAPPPPPPPPPPCPGYDPCP
jgi:hypothetical protein